MPNNINFDLPSVGDVTADGQAALDVTNRGRGAGLAGNSQSQIGVFGSSQTFQGVHGKSEGDGTKGVVGESMGKNGQGVWGLGHAENGTGVLGESLIGGFGVHGKAHSTAGFFAGVFGECTSGKWYGVQGFSKPEGVGALLADGGKHAFVARNGTQSAGRFEGDVEVTGDIKLVNADCAEDFDVADSESKENIEGGTVMVLTENGSLQSSYKEYDKKVAGIVSGASGYKPAIVLDRQDQKSKDRLPIALMGKVYCKVDARNSSIEMGDLLTTSSTRGYAMKAEDPMKAFGAVIGKALGSIKEGMGMIPVLVALQ